MYARNIKLIKNRSMKMTIDDTISRLQFDDCYCSIEEPTVRQLCWLKLHLSKEKRRSCIII